MSDTHDQQVERAAKAITDRWPWTDVPALADEIARAVLDAVSPQEDTGRKVEVSVIGLNGRRGWRKGTLVGVGHVVRLWDGAEIVVKAGEVRPLPADPEAQQ